MLLFLFFFFFRCIAYRLTGSPRAKGRTKGSLEVWPSTSGRIPCLLIFVLMTMSLK